MSWQVYIIECKGGLLYTGITNDIARRLLSHNNRKGSKFTRSRTPVKLLYSEIAANKSSALKREAQIKNLSRAEKLALITD